MWIYVLGERSGVDVKIGKTNASRLRDRVASVNGEQTTAESYVLLAGVCGTPAAEAATHAYFSEFRRADKGRKTEYFHPAERLIEWVLWLRAQWWTCFEEDVAESDWEEVHHNEWVPRADRRHPRPVPDRAKMVQDYEQFKGPLAGTAWSWVPDPCMSFQDYFTEPDIVRRAALAMGSVDLDAASHWIAHRRLHQAGVWVADYFHVNRSAFDNDWGGNVWLNPPYGENERWLARAQKMFETGKVKQLCMISPMHAFQTRVARQMVERADGVVLLSPTPKFFNPADPKRTGTNLPHGVFYWGPRVTEFSEAFREVGVPCRIV